MENILLILIQRFSASLSSRTTFTIYYSFIILLIHLYHGLWLPSKYLQISREEYYQLWAERKTQPERREVRQNLIEPRRDFSTRRTSQAERSFERKWSRFSYARREATTSSSSTTNINIGAGPGQAVVQVEVEI